MPLRRDEYPCRSLPRHIWIGECTVSGQQLIKDPMRDSFGERPGANRFRTVPIVDLFAGPGGLGEGFSSIRAGRGRRAFQISVSIEKDPVAHRTLSLRAMFRHFDRPEDVPEAYYDYVRGAGITRDQLESHPSMHEAAAAAKIEARCATLGEIPPEIVDGWIRDAIRGSEDQWVLIGGPPCQAYSVVGRARQSNVDRSVFEQDHRHLLYREYLRIIQAFSPAVFVMENVKGILSANLGGERIFPRILQDLALGGRYEIRSFVVPGGPPADARNFVIRAEQFGLPQARHRVILLGVRRDLTGLRHVPLGAYPQAEASVDAVLSELPALRSRLSPAKLDSAEDWHRNLRSLLATLRGEDHDLMRQLRLAVEESTGHQSAGASFVPASQSKQGIEATALLRWLRDPRLRGWCNHESRGHMPADLHRYLYAAAYAKTFGFSPKVHDFPSALWPKHRNVVNHDTPFLDRFRVQLSDRPSTTVVSHIAKDGHYFIHPDPSQARSLTVREAARLQTFPDNYFFEGGRTEQFTQVGNAVPPFLAHQLARVVHDLLVARKEVVRQAVA